MRGGTTAPPSRVLSTSVGSTKPLRGVDVARRGFLAEMNHQAKQAEARDRQRRAAHARAVASAERAERKAMADAQRAAASMARADAAAAKAYEKEVARLHVEARQAETELLNAQLELVYAEIDGLLEATLEVDDHVDLEAMKKTFDFPAFDPGPLGNPAPEPPPLQYPAEPTYQAPAAPTGLFGKEKKAAAALEQAQRRYAADHWLWEKTCQEMYDDALEKVRVWREVEDRRTCELAQLRSRYDQDREENRLAVEQHNAEVDELKNNLAFDVPEAIEAYVDLVMSNSVYPDSFPVAHSGKFNLSSRELQLDVTVPEPATLPEVKGFKYIKARDEIVESPLPATGRKARYASAVAQTAVRSLHEVFEADRSGKIESIALTVSVDRVSPSTGLPETVPLVIAAAERENFTQFDLGNVVASATLEHLGASVSKSPYDMKFADGSGIRTRGQA